MINRIRRDHPALHWLRNLRFHNAENSNVMVFSKTRRIGRPRRRHRGRGEPRPDTRDTWFHLNMPELGLGWDDPFPAHDLITGQTGTGRSTTCVWLGPENEPVHIVHVQPY